MTTIAAQAAPFTAPRTAGRAWLRRLHVLLGVQSLVLVLASVNRLSSLGDAAARTRRALRLAFVAALYLFALSYGMHETANYVNDRFCSGDGGQLCEVIRYHDDGLSHLLFFAGFAGIAAVLLIAQAAATGAATAPPAGRDRALVVANASLVGAAIVANLGFEAIGFDLLVVALVAALSLVLLGRAGPRPVIVYFAWAYALGLVATVAVKLA